MGHAIHFLNRLARAGAEETDLALDLYRDPKLLQLVLTRLTLPEGAPRIALSLMAEDHGPWLGLTRGGEFVTCLGEGMAPTGLYQVPYAEVFAQVGQARHVLRQTQSYEKALARRISLSQDSVTTQVRPVVPGRNDPCSCGSGIKYKKCCGK